MTFALAPAPGKQTVLTFSHDGVPDIEAAGIKQGWTDFYWRPLKMMLEGASGGDAAGRRRRRR